MLPWIKVIYVVALVGWTGCQILLPDWQGRSYYKDFQRPGVFQETGSFGLQDDAHGSWQHPIWNPPKTYSDAILTTVRWPWQAVHSLYHVEVNLVHLLEMVSLGFILLGVVLWLGHRMVARSIPDLLVSVAWAVAVGLILAWLVLLGLAFFTMGFALTETVTITTLLAGSIGGACYGVVSFAMYRRVKSDVAGKRPTPGMELFWLTLGAVLSCCVTYAAAWIVENFRGAAAGVTELGTTPFAHDQTTINTITGCTLIALGWLLGLIMWRMKLPVALVAGWVIAMTILGGVFACWH